MPDFHWLQAPRLSPTQCTVCHTHKHDRGFVETGVSDVVGQPIQLCAGCIEQLGRKVGALDTNQAAALEAKLQASEQRVNALAAQLATEQANKMLSLEDARALLIPVPQHKEAATPKPKAKP